MATCSELRTQYQAACAAENWELADTLWQELENHTPPCAMPTRQHRPAPTPTPSPTPTPT